jgi:hypothetical protein
MPARPLTDVHEVGEADAAATATTTTVTTTTTPADPAGPGRRAWSPSPAVVLGWIAVATVLLLLRQPGHAQWDTLWQEDGGVFLSDAYELPWSTTLVSDYNGYLHLVARLLALPAAAVPVPMAADVVAVLAALTVALLSAYVFWASEALLRTLWARTVLAALVVVLPAAGYEVAVNLANLHWYLDFACLLALARAHRRRTVLAADLLVVLLAVLSDPLTGLLVPVAAWAAWRGEARDRAVVGVYVAALAVQAVLGALADSPDPYGPVVLAELGVFYAVRVAGSLLVGDAYLDDGLRHAGAVFVRLALLVVAALMAYGVAAPGASAARRLLVAACAGLSGVFLAAPLLLRGTGGPITDVTFSLNNSRYTLVPVLMLVLAVLVTLDRGDAWLRGRRLLDARILVTLWFAATALTSWSVFTVSTAGPSWDQVLEQARADCAAGRPGPLVMDDPSNGFNVMPEGYVRVPIAPAIEPPPFVTTVPCSRLR